MTDHLIETVESGVATLTMNRPEVRNAMSVEMKLALGEALPRLAADQSVRVVVLAGAGSAFCAGGDVKGQASTASGGFNFEERVLRLRADTELARWLHEMPKPTLAVISGAAAGAGLGLALACDFRIALDSAKLTTAFAKVGLSGDCGVSYFLPALVGAARARELLFTAEVITGQQAFEYGLVNKVANAECLASETDTLIQQLAQLPTVAIGYMKKNLNAARHGTLSEVLDVEAIHMVRTLMTDDHKNAAQAFVEKRTPEFKGR